jgi:hypothetical protein
MSYSTGLWKFYLSFEDVEFCAYRAFNNSNICVKTFCKNINCELKQICSDRSLQEEFIVVRAHEPDHQRIQALLGDLPHHTLSDIIGFFRPFLQTRSSPPVTVFDVLCQLRQKQSRYGSLLFK